MEVHVNHLKYTIWTNF